MVVVLVVVLVLALVLALVLVLVELVAVVVARFSPTHGRGSPRDSQHELGRINNATKVVSAVVFVAAFVLLFAFSYPKLSPSSAWPLTLHYQYALGLGVRTLKSDLQMYVTPMFVCIKPQHRGYFWQMPIL